MTDSATSHRVANAEEIEVSPEMVEVGLVLLLKWYDPGGSLEGKRELVDEVYRAMATMAGRG